MSSFDSAISKFARRLDAQSPIKAAAQNIMTPANAAVMLMQKGETPQLLTNEETWVPPNLDNVVWKMPYLRLPQFKQLVDS
jgi:hypothetical protein